MVVAGECARGSGAPIGGTSELETGFGVPASLNASRNPVARGATRFHQGRNLVSPALRLSGFVKPVTAVSASVRNRVLAA